MTRLVPAPTPATRLCALLGSPVAHSGSPAMHNAAFAVAGRAARYLAFDVADADLAAAVRGLTALGAVGANVTVPHKQRALALADEATPAARRSGSANVLTFRHGRVLAADTDGPGFARAVTEAGADLRGAELLVLGAGGAARAVIAAALAAGARRVAVVNRNPERARRAAADLDDGAGRVRALPASDPAPALVSATVIVNATPLGLQPDDPSPLARWDGVRQDALAVDLVYAGHPTPFVRAAASAGLQAVDGRRMLVWQAALSWEPWFGAAGPVEVMAEALEHWLTGRSRLPQRAGADSPPRGGDPA